MIPRTCPYCGEDLSDVDDPLYVEEADFDSDELGEDPETDETE